MSSATITEASASSSAAAARWKNTAAMRERQLAEHVAACYADPLEFVRTMYPWGEPGPLQDHRGPDVWQAEYLVELGRQVRERQFNGRLAVAPVRLRNRSSK